MRSAAFLLDASVDGLPEMERTTFHARSRKDGLGGLDRRCLEVSAKRAFTCFHAAERARMLSRIAANISEYVAWVLLGNSAHASAIASLFTNPCSVYSW